MTREACKCTKEKKVHPREWDFLVDQRTNREEVIGEVDKKVTEAWRVAQEKVDASENQVLNEENRCQDVRDA